MSDADLLGEAIAGSDEHLRPWMAWMAQEPQTPVQRRLTIERWEEQWRAGGDVLLAVILDGAVAGSCGLHRRVGPGGLEIGYWTRAGFLRRGVATRAAAALTDAALSLRGIDTVEIHHDKANVASAGVPARLGFQMVEEVASDVTAPAEIGVACIWRMRRRAWESRRLSSQAGGAPSRKTGCLADSASSSASLESGPTPSKKAPTSSFQRSR